MHKLLSFICVQSEGPRDADDYEGLNRADVEPIQVRAARHLYAGLGIQATGSGPDAHGYIDVIADPEDGDHSQVCTAIHYIRYGALYRSRQGRQRTSGIGGPSSFLFYRASAVAASQLCTSYDRDVCLSVRPSVCHTLVLSENDAARITKSSPTDSPRTLLFGIKHLSRNSTGVTPSEGIK